MIPANSAPMCLLKSFAYSSTDLGAIPDALARGYNVVVLADVEEKDNYPGCVLMSNLLPPPVLTYQALDISPQDPNRKLLEDQYKLQYLAFLADNNRERSIVNLLASMYKTTHNILLFTEIDVERQFHPIEVITKFMLDNFGILIARYENMFIQDPTVQPCFNPHPKFVFAIVDLLFTNAYITKEEYARMLPRGVLPSPRAIGIILSDFNYALPTMEASIMAACNILDTYRYQQETGLYCPAIRVTQQLDEARRMQIDTIVKNSTTRFGNKTVGELNMKFLEKLPEPPAQDSNNTGT